jgi:hypothetical protein
MARSACAQETRDSEIQYLKDLRVLIVGDAFRSWLRLRCRSCADANPFAKRVYGPFRG